MEFEDVVRRRRIVRHFKPDPVEPDVIEHIMRITQRAPSAGYSQGQSFIVVTNPQTRRAIGRLCGETDDDPSPFRHHWVSEAPVQVVACVSEAAYHRRYQEPDKLRPDGTEIDWPVPYWWFDIGCSCMLFMLAVVNAGLAAGYAGVVDFGPFRELLGIPEDVTPVGVMPVGYPDKDIPSPSLARGRKGYEQFVRRERWDAGES
ncbi:MAG: nitroreductase [Chloroflexi bacterium]|nr:MAG: nitroreductase [Chloroflexota bacterium]